MKKSLYLLTLYSLLSMFNFSQAAELTVGQAAPEFKLYDQHGELHSLRDYQGQWLILYFYPKDDTPGCTKEACAFRDDYQVLQAANTQVLGVSIDDQHSHATFARKYQLPFPLLSDTDGTVAKQYQALLNLGLIKLAKRATFLLDPEGIIQVIYRKVDVNSHSEQILSDLKQRQQ